MRISHHSKLSLVLITAVLSVPQALTAQHTKPKDPKEQSEFGIERDIIPIQRPVTLPQGALDVLSKDDRIASCLENDELSAEELPANWFAASEIHLDGPNETDLVVLPGDRLPDTPPDEPSANACLLGANTGQMWVLRQTRDGVRLVLSQVGLGLTVLSTRSNGLRDIQIGAAGMGYVDSIDYKFDGQSYAIAARRTELGGAELPRALSAFKTRKLLVQLPGQPSKVVRAQARVWLWQQWSLKKYSYLKLKTRDEMADYFIGPGETGEWQIIIQVRRIVRADQATASQHRITERQLLVATEIQRVEPTTDEMDNPRVISKDEILPKSKYRLQFLDDANRTVASL